MIPNDVPPPVPPEDFRGEPCAYHATHNEDGEPTGRACGRKATQVIFWKGGRFSPSCGQHGLPALAPGALALVLCIHPIEAPIVVEALEDPAS